MVGGGGLQLEVPVDLTGDAGVAVRAFGGAPLPAVAAPRAELPDLAESPLWAHVQATGPFPDGLTDVVHLDGDVDGAADGTGSTGSRPGRSATSWPPSAT